MKKQELVLGRTYMVRRVLKAYKGFPRVELHVPMQLIDFRSNGRAVMAEDVWVPTNASPSDSDWGSRMLAGEVKWKKASKFTEVLLTNIVHEKATPEPATGPAQVAPLRYRQGVIA